MIQVLSILGARIGQKFPKYDLLIARQRRGVNFFLLKVG
jgi:hypothetical protein